MSNDEIPVLFENGPLRIRYLKGRGSDLIVSFSGVGTQRAVEPPVEFPRIASAGQQNHVLFVSDSSRSWLNGDGMAGQILRAIEATVRHVTPSGSSPLGIRWAGRWPCTCQRFMNLNG